MPLRLGHRQKKREIWCYIRCRISLVVPQWGKSREQLVHITSISRWFMGLISLYTKMIWFLIQQTSLITSIPQTFCSCFDLNLYSYTHTCFIIQRSPHVTLSRGAIPPSGLRCSRRRIRPWTVWTSAPSSPTATRRCRRRPGPSSRHRRWRWSGHRRECHGTMRWMYSMCIVDIFYMYCRCMIYVCLFLCLSVCLFVCLFKALVEWCNTFYMYTHIGVLLPISKWLEMACSSSQERRTYFSRECAIRNGQHWSLILGEFYWPHCDLTGNGG